MYEDIKSEKHPGHYCDPHSNPVVDSIFLESRPIRTLNRARNANFTQKIADPDMQRKACMTEKKSVKYRRSLLVTYLIRLVFTASLINELLAKCRTRYVEPERMIKPRIMEIESATSGESCKNSSGKGNANYTKQFDNCILKEK